MEGEGSREEGGAHRYRPLRRSKSHVPAVRPPKNPTKIPTPRRKQVKTILFTVTFDSDQNGFEHDAAQSMLRMFSERLSFPISVNHVIFYKRFWCRSSILTR